MSAPDAINPLVELAREADRQAASMRFVAEHNRKRGEVIVRTSVLDNLADVLERAAAAIDALHHDVEYEHGRFVRELDEHQVTKTELANCQQTARAILVDQWAASREGDRDG